MNVGADLSVGWGNEKIGSTLGTELSENLVLKDFQIWGGSRGKVTNQSGGKEINVKRPLINLLQIQRTQSHARHFNKRANEKK